MTDLPSSEEDDSDQSDEPYGGSKGRGAAKGSTKRGRPKKSIADDDASIDDDRDSVSPITCFPSKITSRDGPDR